MRKGLGQVDPHVIHGWSSTFRYLRLTNCIIGDIYDTMMTLYIDPSSVRISNDWISNRALSILKLSHSTNLSLTPMLSSTSECECWCRCWRFWYRRPGTGGGSSTSGGSITDTAGRRRRGYGGGCCGGCYARYSGGSTSSSSVVDPDWGGMAIKGCCKVCSSRCNNSAYILGQYLFIYLLANIHASCFQH